MNTASVATCGHLPRVARDAVAFAGEHRRAPVTYSDEEIRHRLELGEDSGWEFKAVEFAGDRPKSPSREDLADEIAAFANAAGGVLGRHPSASVRITGRSTGCRYCWL